MLRVNRLARAAALAAALALLALTQSTQPPPIDLAAVSPIAASTSHAALVIDTGKEVKRICLAFPEQQLSGAEALRRANVDAVFASYSGGMGEAVCSLCGVGCPAGDCFCDRSRFWAYHRAEPGAGGYTYSRVGASSTVVRDGDVEGWRWGSGAAPPYATVGQVCDVPEPPARAASSGGGGGTTTTAPPPPTTAAGTPSTTTTAPPSAGGAPTRTPAPTTTGGASEPGLAAPGELGTRATELPTPGPATPPEPDESAATVGAKSSADKPAAARAAGGIGSAFAFAGFVAVLAGLLIWRSRLRRANVRRSTTVR